MLQVIWVTGASMPVLMAALIYLPLWAVALFGAALVLAHNAMDGIQPGCDGSSRGSNSGVCFTCRAFLVPPASGNLWLNLYPLIPWPGIMALGFAFGSFLQWPSLQRRRAMLGVGGRLAPRLRPVALERISTAIRDPGSNETSGERTFMSFLDVQKYPPSLLFVMVTLGVSLCLMAAFDAWQTRGSFKAPLRSILSVYGKVPFFYYVLHFSAIHLAALLTTAALGEA